MGEQSTEEKILDAENILLQDDPGRPLSFDSMLMQNNIPLRTIRNIRFRDWKQNFVEQPRAFLKDDLSLNNSYFFGGVSGCYRVNQIPQINVYEEEPGFKSKLYGICDYFPLFKFGGISFKCTHKIPEQYNYIYSGKVEPEDRYFFETKYNIKIDNVYISLAELFSVADWSGILSVVDDFIIAGNHDNSVLTIIDNDLDYSACGSGEKYDCYFKPVFCIDRGVPVKYIKTVDDSKPMENAFVPERRFEYDMQRKQTLKNLNNVFKPSGVKEISGYPTEIDFIVKTGLHEFVFLSYDRFKNDGDFWFTKVNYSLDGADPRSVIKKCDFRNLQQNINLLQRARANHFNKMYAQNSK